MKTLAGHLRRFQRSIPQLKRDVARKVVSVESAQFHQQNFDREGYQDTHQTDLWPARKDGDTSRKLLISDGRNKKTTPGRLRRAALSPRTSGEKVKYTMPKYGKVHNEGGRAGRGRGFRMPRRRFAGPSGILKKRIHQKAVIIINRRLNRL